jgi:hypothetical protein
MLPESEGRWGLPTDGSPIRHCPAPLPNPATGNTRNELMVISNSSSRAHIGAAVERANDNRFGGEQNSVNGVWDGGRDGVA